MSKRKEHRFDNLGNELKHCSGCEEWLPIENFSKNKTTWDKLQSNCKICLSQRSCKWEKENPRSRCYSDSRRDYFANRRANNPEYRHKIRIRAATNNAINRGDLIRPTHCELCGFPSDRIQAHHHSYDPKDYLDVTFLCVPCHESIHHQLKLENPMFEDDNIDPEETIDTVADQELQNHLDLIAAIDLHDSEYGHA